MSGVLDVLAGATGAAPAAFGSTGSELYACGDNTYGQLGLGTSGASGVLSLSKVGTLTDWSAIDCGYFHTVAIKTDGTLWSWGRNNNGQLGINNITNYSSPKQVGVLTNWLNVSSGPYSSLAIKTDGTLWSWGHNPYGQLGLNNITNYSSPKQVGVLTNWSKISINFHAAAIKTDGTLWSWGYNATGGLGLGNITVFSSPKQVGALTNWSTISAGMQCTFTIKTNGTLWTWGRNTYGQLGHGNMTDLSSPKQVGALTTWSTISGYYSGLAVKTDGTLWSWGNNSAGQLGLSNTYYFSSPKQVGSDTNWKTPFIANASHAIKTDGTLWAWGDGSQGRLGLGNQTTYSSPKQVGSGTNWGYVSIGDVYSVALTKVPATVPDKPTNVVADFGDTTASVAFTSPKDGGSAITSYTVTAYTGGVSTGITTSGVSNYITITGLTNGTAYTFTVKATNAIGTGKESDTSAVITYKGLLSFGWNTKGQLGQGNLTTLSNPTAVGSLTNWANVSAGFVDTSTAVKTDGTLWTWGKNNNGQLGLGNTTYYSSPKQVGALTNWSITTNTGASTFAIKTNGTLWSWGRNDFGQLGLGNTTYYSSPKQVGSDTTWKSVVGSSLHIIALKTDGTLWSWGRNNSGQLGYTAGVNYSSPKQVGALTTWASVAVRANSSFAIKTNGTLWAWGLNSTGDLGLGDVTVRYSPVQVGGLTDWLKITAGYATLLAIKTNGTLWSWGQNPYGQLGLGNKTTYSSPKQVGALTTWSTTASGYGHVFAIKTDGTLWSWGQNPYGQLGLGNITSYSSPKQVGSDTNWIAISGGDSHSLAINNQGNSSVTPIPITFTDDVFSTYLYTGTGAAQTITNGINLAGQGGMVWIKSRSAGQHNAIFDTVRGSTAQIYPDLSYAQDANGAFQSFNSDGFSLNANRSGSDENTNGYNYVSWTFRKAEKFFDVVTYTGNGSNSQVLNHSLGIAPGMIFIKSISGNQEWRVLTSTLGGSALVLNTSATTVGTSLGMVANNTTFSVGGPGYGDIDNTNGVQYVAYLFAHDASSTGIIQCGSTGGGSTEISLGWEPQYLIFKSQNFTDDWHIIDNMRGANVGVSFNTWNELKANSTGGDTLVTGTAGTRDVEFTSNGFILGPISGTAVYMAIRRPNKPPTSGTQVFSPVTLNSLPSSNVNTGFPPDFILWNARADGANINVKNRIADRLRGFVGTSYWAPSLFTSQNVAEFSNDSDADWLAPHFPNNGFRVGGPTPITSGTNIFYAFKRAPGFFDVVCYKGDGYSNANPTGLMAGRSVSHSLKAPPELVFLKDRNGQSGWWIFSKQDATKNLRFSTGAFESNTVWLNAQGTSKLLYVEPNSSGMEYVAYLFATLAGISKVGSYTGNGTTQAINCGFTAGARFVLIKRTDSTGDWYIWDTARSINPGNEPHLSLNNTAAEVTTDDTMDYDTNGFVVNQVAATNVNVSSATYIFLAIA